MKKLFVIVMVFLAGCQPPGPTKVDHATSLVSVVAERLVAEKDENGLKIYKGVEELDPWGQELTLKYEEHTSLVQSQTITVRSNGPDKLPYTRDDITASKTITLPAKAKVSLAERLEKNSEAITRGMFRGVVKGSREGMK